MIIWLSIRNRIHHLVLRKDDVTSLTIKHILTLLGAAPSRIATLTADLTPAQLHTSPQHDEWSANDVLAHLRSCSDVWGTGIETIITQDRPTIRAVNPRTWLNRTDYTEQEFQPSLQAFTEQRTNLLAQLEPLALADWSRTARVTGAGKVLEWTVLSYAQRLATHERSHVKQLARIVNTIHTI